MYTLYISFLMFTSLISAMQEPASLGLLRAKLNATTKQIEELQKKLDMNIPAHEATTLIVGFGPNQKVIDNSATQVLSHDGKPVPTAAAKHQPIDSLDAYPNRDIQIATHAPRTILHTLKKATRRGNLAILESTTPINVPAAPALRVGKSEQISQIKTHSATPPAPLCYSYSSYLPSDPYALPKEQKHANFQRIEGFNLPIK